MLGDLLNAATWAEVLRLFAAAHLRYARALFVRHGREEWPDKEDALATAIEVPKRTAALCIFLR